MGAFWTRIQDGVTGVERGGVTGVAKGGVKVRGTGVESGAVRATGVESGGVRIRGTGIEEGGVRATGVEAGGIRATGIEEGGVVGVERGGVVGLEQGAFTGIERGGVNVNIDAGGPIVGLVALVTLVLVTLVAIIAIIVYGGVSLNMNIIWTAGGGLLGATLFYTISQVQSLKANNRDIIAKLEDRLNIPERQKERIPLNEQQLPIGTMLPWLPQVDKNSCERGSLPRGWMLCNGDVIREGHWKNLTVPNLNGDRGLFLRGGPESLAGKVEEDALQNHTHEDQGHTHQDSGHTHDDLGHSHQDDGHTHQIRWKATLLNGFDIRGGGAVTIPVPTGAVNSDTADAKYSDLETSKSVIGDGKAHVSTSQADIQRSKADISGPKDCRTDEETRPANMRVVWIIKVMPS